MTPSKEKCTKTLLLTQAQLRKHLDDTAGRILALEEIVAARDKLTA